MEKIYILCVDDEPDVLDVVIRELAELEDVFPIELAENSKQAEGIVERIESNGGRLGLILCDHVMPGKSGVDFLISLENRASTKGTRKVLLTGQAGLSATVDAVNNANLSHYISKPWKTGELMAVSKVQLSHYFIKEGLEAQSYMGVLDPLMIAEAIRKGLMGDL